MKLPPDAVIAPAKITGYLLRWQDENDKSAFLARAGYTQENSTQLLADIRGQLLPLEAELIGQTEYGTKFRIRGSLRGPNGNALRVITIWMIPKSTGIARFVTLYPDKP
jgi:hypothetical protein